MDMNYEESLLKEKKLKQHTAALIIVALGIVIALLASAYVFLKTESWPWQTLSGVVFAFFAAIPVFLERKRLKLHLTDQQ